MDLSNEDDRSVAHMFVKDHFGGNYAHAVNFLTDLSYMNDNAHKTVMYSQKYGFIDVHLSGDNNEHTPV